MFKINQEPNTTTTPSQVGLPSVVISSSENNTISDPSLGVQYHQEKHQELLHSTAFNSVKNYSIYSESDGEYIVPKNIKTVYLSLCSGGGRGGKGEVINKIYFSGGGGGAGEGYIRIPIKIESDEYEIKIKYQVGKGGRSKNEDGEDTIFTIFLNGTYHSSITAHGGKHGTSECGGQGCSRYTPKDGWGRPGKFFSAANTISNIVHNGGQGGFSPFYRGGKGFTRSMQDRTECNGKWGSGGGGGVDDLYFEKYGFGGDGFILIEIE